MPVTERKPLTLSERLILRAWMREYRHPEGTRAAYGAVATACGVTVGRVIGLVQRSTYVEREACRG